MLHAPSDSDLAMLQALTGDGAGAVPEGYLVEPRGRHRGQAAALLRPRDTETVAAVIRHCARAGIGVLPGGGGTGLVGGQVSGEGPAPVILSLERMDRVREVAPDDDAMTVEAGAILADVQAAAAAAGRLFPLSMASQGSARIGGALATNAGGVQVLRYGNARDLVLGIEAVLPDGSIHHGLKTLRKDNTGYDLRHLLIGAEGTLGVITAASLRLFPRPGEVMTAMLAVPDPAAAHALFERVRARIEGLSAVELIAGAGVAFVRAGWPEQPDPLTGAPPWRVLIEATGPEGAGLAERAEAVLADALEAGLADDGVIAQSEGQRAAMWHLREMIPEGNRRIGAIASHDISVPLSAVAGFIEAAGRDIAAIDPGVRINCFGHLGDGNLHYNLFPAERRRAADYAGIAPKLTAAVYARAVAMGGSISAEHGIGRAKRDELAARSDPAKLAAMRAIKAALDPAGIMNPGAVLAGPEGS